MSGGKIVPVDAAAAANLTAALAGVDLPAEKTALLEQAVRRRAAPALIEAIRSLPERAYASLDEVAEALMRVAD